MDDTIRDLSGRTVLFQTYVDEGIRDLEIYLAAWAKFGTWQANH